MFADDEKALALIDSAEKIAHTEITVGNPNIARLHRGKDLTEQGALLRMAIFTGKDIDRHSNGGIVDHQRFARQRTGG